MKETIVFIFVSMLLLSGLFLGVYSGNRIVVRQRVIKWNWYQPSEGPDMGKWKQGSSGEFVALIIVGGLMVIGSALGLGIGLFLMYLVKTLIYPLIINMRVVPKALIMICLLIGSCYGFYLGHSIIESFMITHWTAYYMGAWDSWRYGSSWGIFPLSVKMITTASGLVVGLLVGLFVGLLIEKCISIKSNH